MGLFSGLTQGAVAGAGSAIKDTLSGIGTLATSIRSAITGQMSPDQQAALQTQLNDLESKAELAQAAVNQAEAGNVSVFVAGWRPAVGWICALGFAIEFVLHPIAQWVIQMFSILDPVTHQPMQLFQLDLSTMLPVLIGMLGLGTMRSVEKIQNAQGNH